MYECAHRWLIAPADGSRLSAGVCQGCGLIREFENWFDEESPGAKDMARRNNVRRANAKRAQS